MLVFWLLLGLFLILWFVGRQKKSLEHIPGPSLSIWSQWRSTQSLNPLKQHTLFAELKKKYGPIFKFSAGMLTKILVCDYEDIYQVTVKAGKEFGGRPTTFRLREVLKGSGILFSYKNDQTWKTLRKVSQKHLRQFGDGISRIESIICDVAEDMFGDFKKNEGRPFDPSSTIFDTALNSIAFLITGERTHSGDQIVEDMREYENLLLTTSSVFAPFSFVLLNIFPWLKVFKFDQWAPYQRFAYLHESIWKEVKRMNKHKPESESICKVLQDHISKNNDIVNEDDASSTALSLLFAGVTTTSTTFYGSVNLLAHHPHVQEAIHAEIVRVNQANGRSVNLTDRPDMPYSRAVLYEILRYTSVVAQGVMHRTMEDTILGGLKIPADTFVEVSIWNLHHDEKYWEHPYEFRPERFLDESGDVVPADHPNRKHLMPFGAGIRVCLGESLAMARLFLWVTSLVSRFEVSPAPGNHKSSTDARSFSHEGVLKATTYEVLFKERK